MAQMNYRLAAGRHHVHDLTNPTWSYLSSSLVKDVGHGTAATSPAWCPTSWWPGCASSRPAAPA